MYLDLSGKSGQYLLFSLNYSPLLGAIQISFALLLLIIGDPKIRLHFAKIPLLARFRANCDSFPPHPNLESSSSSLYFQRSSHMASLFESGLIAQKLRDLGIKIVPQGLNRS